MYSPFPHLREDNYLKMRQRVESAVSEAKPSDVLDDNLISLYNLIPFIIVCSGSITVAGLTLVAEFGRNWNCRTVKWKLSLLLRSLTWTLLFNHCLQYMIFQILTKGWNDITYYSGLITKFVRSSIIHGHG
jgi:hypothetical protein